MTIYKLMIIVVVSCLTIITLVLWLTYYDIKTANEAIAVREHKELKSIPDGVNEAKIKELIREADLSAFRLEQHRLELEGMLKMEVIK